jgi:flagellar motor component MotA
VLRGLGRNFIYLSILGMIMGLIAVLSLFDPPDTFAQGLATLIITPLYAMMGNILLVNPFLHRLDAMDGVLN